MMRSDALQVRCHVSSSISLGSRDQSALYRRVGSPEIMAAQLRHLVDAAAMPNVVLQVMPEVAHDALAASYVLADDAVWSEHMVSGGVYTDPVIVSSVAACHDNLRGECLKVSESLALIGRLAEQWTGGNQPTRQVTAGQCVEVASDDTVMVRDTTDRDGRTLAFSVAAWLRFLGTIR